MTVSLIARPRLRILLFTGAVALAVALLLPFLYARLLELTAAQADEVRGDFFVLVPLVLTVAGSTLWRMLRRAKSLHAGGRVDEAARAAVLEVPTRLAEAVVVSGEIACALGVVHAIFVRGMAMPLAVGIGLCTGAMTTLIALPIYAFARAELLTLATQLGDENLPAGRRLTLPARYAYTIMAVAASTVLPVTLFSTAHLDHAAQYDAEARARATADRLAAAADLDVAAATALLSHTPLAAGARSVLRVPSGTLLPEDAIAEVAGMPYVEAPTTGVLRGGAVRVYYPIRRADRLPLLGVALVILLLAALVAMAIGAGIGRDASALTTQIERVASSEEPAPVAEFATLEVRRVTLAINRLLERIPQLTIESYLAIERAEEARRLKSQFLANMSHDLRSPLNSILGFSELLLRGLEGPISTKQRMVLANLHALGISLLRLLIEILETAKLESGRVEIHRRRSPPAELVTQAATEARRGRPGDHLTIVLQPGLQPISCDPLRLTQAVTHLLDYALDVVDGGAVTLRAHEGEAGNSRAFVVEVEHQGALGQDEQARLFDDFRKIPGRAGLYLALPLARRLIELMGGRLSVEVGETTRLQAVIPVERRIERTTPVADPTKIP